MENTFRSLLQVDTPIIQAPMAGGATTPLLVAEVSNAGGLGSLGAGYLSPEDLRLAIQAVRNHTKKLFNVNLFTPNEYAVSNKKLQQSCDAINACSVELGITVKPVCEPYSVDFDEQVSVLLAEKTPVVSFMFGIPGEEIISALKKNGSVIIGTATTLDEALFLEANRIDIIVAQGSEAGGHRGSFLKKEEESLVARDELLRRLVENIRLPIVAAGGIMDGEGIARLLRLGASAVQMGTAFLYCPEAGISQAYQDMLCNQKADNTVLTRAFSGRLARGISNKFTQCMDKKEGSFSDYPVQNKLTASLRKHAIELANADYLSLWAGQGVHCGRALPVRELMRALQEEITRFGRRES